MDPNGVLGCPGCLRCARRDRPAAVAGLRRSVAGLNAKELSVYIGHADIRVTYNRYGHLMPGGEEQAAKRLTEFLAGAG